MICNITFGDDPSGLADYVAGPALDEHGRPIIGTENRARLIGSQGFGYQVRTPDDVRRALSVLRKDVALQASPTKPITRTVMHMSLAWHPGYQPSKAEVLRADKHFAQALGLEEARRIIWRHDDKEKRPDGASGYSHVHEAIGLVNRRTGFAFDRYQLREKAMRAALIWERENNQITQARERQHAIARAVEASNHAEVLRLNRAPDESIARYKIDRAAALGGRFGKAMGAYRAALIADQKLEPFPHNRRQTYAEHEVAKEKKQHIHENRAVSRNLYKAHGREERSQMFDKLKEEIRSRLWAPREARASDEYQPRVKILGYEFGESGRKARGTEGLYKAKDTEEWRKISDRNHTSHIEGLKVSKSRGPSEETIDRMNKDLIDKTKREAPRWRDDAEHDQEMRGWRPEATPINPPANHRHDPKQPRELPGDGPQTRKNIDETWRRNQDDVAREAGKSRAEREEQGREIQDRKVDWRDLLRDKDEYWKERSKQLSKVPPEQERRPINPIEKNGMEREVSKARESAIDERNKERSQAPRKNWEDKLARLKEETQAQKLDKADPPTREQARDDLNVTLPPSRALVPMPIIEKREEAQQLRPIRNKEVPRQREREPEIPSGKKYKNVNPFDEKLDRLTAQAFEGADRFKKIDPKAEEARLKNWEIQRERHLKEEMREAPIRTTLGILRGQRDETPAWHKEEKRMDDERREKYARDVRDIENERAASPRLPYQPNQSRDPDEPQPRELPPPKPRDFMDELREKTKRIELPKRGPDDGMNRGPKR